MSWELAYEHDEAGKPVAGKFAHLLKAIENGAEVRCGIGKDENQAFFTPDYIRYTNGEIFAEFHRSFLLKGYDPNRPNKFEFNQPPRQFISIVSTSGNRYYVYDWPYGNVQKPQDLGNLYDQSTEKGWELVQRPAPTEHRNTVHVRWFVRR